jgi:hypothetical protein
MNASALKTLVNHINTYRIPIDWRKEIIKFNAFGRWVELWQQD